jgi:signal transduction histidine kinase
MSSAKLKDELAMLYRYSVVAMVCWTIIVVGSLIWNIYELRQSLQTLAINEALSSFKRDEALRLFISSRGGVYVPLDDKTPSNLYLHHPERDVTTTSGKKLTLMNGAYVFSKVEEEYGQISRVNWRLTSLKPVNPANTPDEWEQNTLQNFEKEAKAVWGFSDIKGDSYLRLLSPLVTQPSCLKCHAYQGYTVGEIRGAMGVSLPMAPYLTEQRKRTEGLIWGHVTFLMLGLAGMGFITIKYRKRISENIRAEEELRRNRDQLEEQTVLLARSNADLEQFAYVASHDLQEPLRMVASFTQLLAKRYRGKLDTEADEFISFAVDGANRMHALINDLMTYSRVTRRGRAFSPVNCEQVLDEVIDNLKLVIDESGAEITRDALPTIMGDHPQVSQVFQNLIMNAIKFGGEQRPQIHISAESKGNEWVFSIRDNGIGIKSDYHERIFMIFQRLKDKEGTTGTGVGLAICKKIVERHGGRIWVESESGKGSTFYFSFPMKGGILL